MSGNFDDLETTVRKSSVIQERMSLVSSHMYKQFLEYQQSNANTAVLFERMVENMALTVEYLKQSFTVRGIPSENIYYEYDKQRHIAIMNILWHSITFYSNMKDKPKALHREKDVPLFTGRIIAIKGMLPELLQGYNDETEQKLLDMEVASLYVPADKSGKAIIKIRHLGNQEFYINQMEAPREFLLKVIETICGGGNYHKEGSRVTISI
ncbi:TPA: hypothetical protein IAA87_07135 [Candidatus Avigastranaerophilus faecigallinarum]|nr:hypothetical protein [Candidatus Avigastranaerophilus faecigallinarum]